MKPKASRKLLPGTAYFHFLVFTCECGSHPNCDHIRRKKPALLVLVCLIFLLISGLDLKAQAPVVLFDTIRFERERYNRFDYVVYNSTTKSIGYKQSSFKKCKGDHFSVAGDVGREMLTLFTGLGTGATKEVNWLMAGTITTDDDNLNWKVDIYCPGRISKSKIRVRNDEGSLSTESNRETEIYWEESVGFIVHESDTIGSFTVIDEPRATADLTTWTDQVYDTDLKGSKALRLSKTEFALWGDLYGQEFLIIFNSQNNLMYLYRQTELNGIYQTEQWKPFTRKKKIKKPFLLVNSYLPEVIKSDVLLLSMLGQWFLVSSNEPE